MPSENFLTRNLDAGVSFFHHIFLFRSGFVFGHQLDLMIWVKQLETESSIEQTVGFRCKSSTFCSEPSMWSWILEKPSFLAAKGLIIGEVSMFFRNRCQGLTEALEEAESPVRGPDDM